MIKTPVTSDPIIREFARQVEQADKFNYKRNQDAEFGENRLILTSPNGTRYVIKVDDLGNLVTEVI